MVTYVFIAYVLAFHLLLNAIKRKGCRIAAAPTCKGHYLEKDITGRYSGKPGLQLIVVLQLTAPALLLSLFYFEVFKFIGVEATYFH